MAPPEMSLFTKSDAQKYPFKPHPPPRRGSRIVVRGGRGHIVEGRHFCPGGRQILSRGANFRIPEGGGVENFGPHGPSGNLALALTGGQVPPFAPWVHLCPIPMRQSAPAIGFGTDVISVLAPPGPKMAPLGNVPPPPIGDPGTGLGETAM